MWCDARTRSGATAPLTILERLMDSNAGYMQMGSQPVAGRARAMQPCAPAISAAAHAGWLRALKPAARTFVTVPDSTGHRRPRGTT